MTTPQQQPAVTFLPGMQGRLISDRWFVRGLREGGLTRSNVFDWTTSRWVLRNLRDRSIHQRGAERLAGWVRRRRKRRPHQPIVLIGHSTGAMVICDTLRQLEEGTVAIAMFLAGAVSSDYDLRPVLTGVKRLINVHSSGDWLVLGAGTKLFGTADGQYGRSAGYTGFTGPGCDDRRLEQVPYNARWLTRGNLGGHMTALSRFYACDVLAPMILDQLKLLESA